MLRIGHSLRDASTLVAAVLTSKLLDPLRSPLCMTRHTLAPFQHCESAVQISPTTWQHITIT